MYSLDTVWLRYCEVLAEVQNDKPSAYHSQNFKDRIYRYLQGNIEFVRPLNPHEHILVFPTMSAGAAVQLLNESYKGDVDDDDMLCHSDLETVDIETETLSWLYRVALKIRGDITAVDGHSVVGDITMDHAEKMIPQSLYLLLSKDDE